MAHSGLRGNLSVPIGRVKGIPARQRIQAVYGCYSSIRRYLKTGRPKAAEDFKR